MAITLFDDQEAALARVLERYQEKPVGGRALVTAATGWGKTVFAAALIKALQGQLQNKRILFIAHRDELLEQAREKIQLVLPGADIGKMGGGTHEYGHQITVAGIDTIVNDRHLERLQKQNIGLIICDECHHSPAPKYMKVIDSLRDAFWLGITATPERLDGADITGIYGQPVFRMSIIEAVQKKRLSDIKAIAIRTELNLTEVKSSKNMDGEIDFNVKALDKAVNTSARNQRVVNAYKEHAQNKLGICFCVSVAHAEALAAMFSANGVPAACVKGSTSLEERAHIYNAFREREIQILTNVQVLTEGFDVKEVETVIMARPTQSRSLFLQCVGRGMRALAGKSHCLLLELTDNYLKHKLAPQNLRAILGLNMHADEGIIDALARVEEEMGTEEERKKRELQEEREAILRKLNVKRFQDQQVDLLNAPKWQLNNKGAFVLEAGKGQLALVAQNKSLFEPGFIIWAKLKPGAKAQKWYSGQALELEVAQILAEQAAAQLSSDAGAVKILDRNEPWRARPIDPYGNAIKKLKWHKIPWDSSMTQGDASEAIDMHLAVKQVKLTAKIARKAEKEAKKRDAVEISA